MSQYTGMSQPLPYNSEPVNPDSRPLPPGWVQQYDPNYKTWFYVNTQERPPRSSWSHPLGPLPPPPAPAPLPGYAPPITHPSHYQGSYSQGSGWNHGAPPLQQWSNEYSSPPLGGWNNSPPYGGSYGGYGRTSPPQNQYSGYPHGDQRGWFGGHQEQQYEQHYQQYSEPYQPHKSSGVGMGTALAAGGVGLLGGVLLAEAIDDRDDNAYEEGFDNGAGF